MTETVSSKASADGWNEPTKNLPPLEVRELPEPVPLGKLIGASVILLATALGSGELLIWPYITTQAGVGLLWLATLGFLSQYFLNMEIERYTLATGETAVTGFSRFWKPLGDRICPWRDLAERFPWLGGERSHVADLPHRLG
jgi:ribosome modulation factor